jgi:ATP-dependent RNA helicase DDX55/SPB4
MAPERKDVTRAWEGLTPALSEWILHAISSMGFNKMTPVQANCIPLFMGNKDVVVEVSTALELKLKERTLTFLIGRHGQWKDTRLPHPNCGEIAKTLGSH